MSEEASRPFDPLDYRNIATSVVRALLDRAPVRLADLEPFNGAGIYALYYAGNLDAYRSIAGPEARVPIYVGKAVPPGSRTGADEINPEVGTKFYNRLSEHSRSIGQAQNLEVAEFLCRYLRVRHVWIRLAEQILVQKFRPVWNTVVDGFGNHPPGRGRRNMRRPRWDIVHPGRSWADRLEPRENRETIVEEVRGHLQRFGDRPELPFAQNDG